MCRKQLLCSKKDGIDMIERAKAFATLAHEGQFRKGTTRPYIVHPLEVGEIVATMTDDEEMVVFEGDNA